jgi:hypothetical protein
MRNSGRTTRQIINAPKNSIYICRRMEILYNKRLAQINNREDLTFVSCNYLKAIGIRKFVIIDHAIQIGQDITCQDYDYIKFHNSKMKEIIPKND